MGKKAEEWLDDLGKVFCDLSKEEIPVLRREQGFRELRVDRRNRIAIAKTLE
jgi:hypothetical protein